MTITPDRVYALVVGIEKYQAGSAWDLDGPANDALKFASWLLNRDVMPEHIQLFLSPLDRNAKVIEDARLKGLTHAPATRDQIDLAIRNKLTSENNSGDLLYIFWGGHGIVTKTNSTTRRLFFADTDDINKWNLNLDSLVEALSTSAFSSGFSQQNFLIDACANTHFQGLYQTIGAESAASRFSTNGEQRKAEQFILFASAAYEVATNESGTGRFSRAVLDELQGQALLPDMKALAERIQTNFREKQHLEPVYWSYELGGNKEVIDNIDVAREKASSATISASPTATSQLQVPDELGDAYSLLLEALMSAFSDQEALALMVRKALKKSLNEITQGASTYEATVDRLIIFAEANGRLQDLVEGALQRNPNNPKLKTLARTWGLK